MLANYKGNAYQVSYMSDKTITVRSRKYIEGAKKHSDGKGIYYQLNMRHKQYRLFDVCFSAVYKEHLFRAMKLDGEKVLLVTYDPNVKAKLDVYTGFHRITGEHYYIYADGKAIDRFTLETNYPQDNVSRHKTINYSEFKQLWQKYYVDTRY